MATSSQQLCGHDGEDTEGKICSCFFIIGVIFIVLFYSQFRLHSNVRACVHARQLSLSTQFFVLSYVIIAASSSSNSVSFFAVLSFVT